VHAGGGEDVKDFALLVLEAFLGFYLSELLSELLVPGMKPTGTVTGRMDPTQGPGPVPWWNFPRF